MKQHNFRFSPLVAAGLALLARCSGRNPTNVIRHLIFAETARKVADLLDHADWPAGRVAGCLANAAPPHSDYIAGILTDLAGEEGSLLESPHRERLRAAVIACESLALEAPEPVARGGWSGRDIADGSKTVETINEEGEVTESREEPATA